MPNLAMKCQMFIFDNYISSLTWIEFYSFRSSHELSYTLATMQRISQQLPPPPYVTMCKTYGYTRATCLDHCLPLMVNDESALMDTNSVSNDGSKYVITQTLIAAKCTKLCSQKPDQEWSFLPLKWQIKWPNPVVVKISLTEKKSVTTPSLTFDDLHINLLNVSG